MNFLLSNIESVTEKTAEGLGTGVESGIKYGGKALIAILFWYGAVIFGLLAGLFTLLAIVKTSQKKKSKGAWVTAIVFVLLTIALRTAFKAINPAG